jgi:hypothetical protein
MYLEYTFFAFFSKFSCFFAFFGVSLFDGFYDNTGPWLDALSIQLSG